MTGTAGAISIGRNVGSVPLPEQDWQRFVRDVQTAVEAEGGIVYAVAYGRGEWDNVAEDNAVVTFDGVDTIESLRDRLVLIAATFHQDAIALLTGSTELVGVTA